MSSPPNPDNDGGVFCSSKLHTMSVMITYNFKTASLMPVKSNKSASVEKVKAARA